MENYRTFIGLPLEVDLAFLQSRKELMAALESERISWVIPKNFHLTLRFLGDIPSTQVDQIREALNSKLSLPEVGRQCFSGPGVFGPRKKPRVVWVGFSQTEVFHDLKKDVNFILESCGFPREEDKFNPHLTLGRIRSMKDIRGFYETVDSFKGDFRSRVTINRLIFYRSELGPAGPRYLALGVYPFIP